MSRITLHRRLALVTLAATVAVSACGGDDDSAQPERASLTVTHLANLSLSLPIHVAIEEGFYAAHGLDVEFIPGQSGPGMAAMLASASVDIAYMSSDAAAALIDGGQDLRLLGAAQSDFDLVADTSRKTAHAGQPYPAPLLDLAGATIGVTARGAAAETVISAMLVDAGLDPARDVTFVATGPPASSAAAMTAGQIDALPGIASTRVQYPALGLDVYVVASIADGTAGRFANGYINSIAFTTPDIADQRSDDIGAWCAAMADTIAWMQDDANEQRLDQLAAEWLMLPDAATAAEAIAPTLDRHIASVSEQQWRAQFELFPQLTAPSYDDVAFAPCEGL